MYKGLLTLKKNSTDYEIYSGGYRDNITETLNSLLLDNVKVQFESDGKVLFDEEGILSLKKINGKLYNYFVGSKNLDKVLWENVNNKISLLIKNIKEEKN